MRKEQLIENDRKLTQQDINQLEAFADKLFARVGIDVEFTRHFLQRVNDERNKKQITMAELTRLFKQEFKRWGKPIAKLGPDTEAIMKDMRTDINMPFALELNSDNELDLIAKTIMRKKDFKSNAPGEPEFKIESKDAKPLDVYTPTIKELQKKYDVKMKDLTAQIDKGVKVEMEHTNDPKVALEIALDHINEDLFYYSKLAKVEERLFPGAKKMDEAVLAEALSEADPMNPTVGNYDLDTLQRKVARDFAQMAEEASKAKSRREWNNIMHQLSNNTMYQLEDILDTYETLQARYSKGGPNSRGIDKSRLESVSDVEEGIFNPIDSAKKFANDMFYSGRNMDVAIELMHKIITKKGTDAKHGIGYYADKVARQFPEDTINVRALIDAYKASYGMNERKLTGGEKRSKESHFKKLKKHKGDFEKRYGKDAESVMHGVATKRAKKESVDEAKGPCWDGYEKVPGKKDYEKGSCRKVKEYANMAEADEITIEGYDEIRGDLSVELSEAEYQGRKVELNKPMQGDVKKFKVYVKNDKGNVVKVNFGEKGAKIKKNNPERRKSFRARHNCDNPGPKWKARYWSCRKW